MPEILYTSFDEVPGPKGAARHIESFANAIAERYGTLLLVTPGSEDQAMASWPSGVQHAVLGCPDDNPIGRARTFRVKLARMLQGRSFRVVHFRSVFEGYPLALEASAQPTGSPIPAVRDARFLYEVNGFPSIELKYHYRRLLDDDRLSWKLAMQEQACLAAADAVITVSEVNRQHIATRDVGETPVTVIRNGVDVRRFPFQAAEHPGSGPLRIAYSGTMTSWQGVATLLEAVHLTRRQRDVQLRLMGPCPRRRRRTLDRLCRKWEIEDVVEFLPAGDQDAVCRLYHSSHLTVVPLLSVDRNTEQGCCPLKLLEALAAGCPVIASNLPVVQELAEPDAHYWPARPGDPRNLKNLILQVAENYDDARHRALAATGHVVRHHDWARAHRQLLEVYDGLLGSDSRSCESLSASACSE